MVLLKTKKGEKPISLRKQFTVKTTDFLNSDLIRNQNNMN